MSGLSAKPERDTAFRDRARIVALALRKLTRGMLSNPETVQRLASGTVETSIALPVTLMQDVGMPGIEVPVVLVPDSANFGALYATPGPKTGRYGTIFLPVLPPIVWIRVAHGLHSEEPHVVEAARKALKRGQADIDAWFEERQSFVVHEMIHMFDHFRLKGVPQTVMPAAGGREAYLNSPIELNAHLQEMLTEIEERLERLQPEIQAATISDFETFWGVARHTRIYKQAWPYLTPKNQRKFYTRTFQFWQSLQPQETPAQRSAPIRFPLPQQRGEPRMEQRAFQREVPREHTFDRLQREIEERRRRRR